jgi:hypothetical protein
MGSENWAKDPYWTEALAEVGRRCAEGDTELKLDLNAICRTAYEEDGPAYRLMEAMHSVRERERA